MLFPKKAKRNSFFVNIISFILVLSFLCPNIGFSAVNDKLSPESLFTYLQKQGPSDISEKEILYVWDKLSCVQVLLEQNQDKKIAQLKKIISKQIDIKDEAILSINERSLSVRKDGDNKIYCLDIKIIGSDKKMVSKRIYFFQKGIQLSEQFRNEAGINENEKRIAYAARRGFWISEEQIDDQVVVKTDIEKTAKCEAVSILSLKGENLADVLFLSNDREIISAARTDVYDLSPKDATDEEISYIFSLLRNPALSKEGVLARQKMVKTLLKDHILKNLISDRINAYSFLGIIKQLESPEGHNERDDKPFIRKLLSDKDFDFKKFKSLKGSIQERLQAMKYVPEGSNDTVRVLAVLQKLEQLEQAIPDLAKALKETNNEILIAIAEELEDQYKKLPVKKAVDIADLLLSKGGKKQTIFDTSITELRTFIIKVGALTAFARIVKNNDLAEARFDETKPAHYAQGWNFLRKKEGEKPQVKNDSGEDRPVRLITGSNMSGKSHFLAQNLFMQLTAQAFGYVPAGVDNNFRIYRRIAYIDRASTESTNNLSAFGSEVEKWKKVLAKDPNAETFVISDEAFSTTSPEDQRKLLNAVKQYLSEHGARFLLANHNEEFIDDCEADTNVAIYHLKIKVEDDGNVKLFHKLEEGPDDSRALDIAKKLGLPPTIIQGAENYLEKKQVPVPVNLPSPMKILEYSPAEREGLKKQIGSFMQFFPRKNTLVLARNDRDRRRGEDEEMLFWRYSEERYDMSDGDRKYCLGERRPESSAIFKLFSGDSDFESRWGSGLDSFFQRDKIINPELPRYIQEMLQSGSTSDPREVLERQKFFQGLIQPGVFEELKSACWDIMGFMFACSKELEYLEHNNADFNTAMLERCFHELTTGYHARESNQRKFFMALLEMNYRLCGIDMSKHKINTTLEFIRKLDEFAEKDEKYHMSYRWPKDEEIPKDEAERKRFFDEEKKKRDAERKRLKEELEALVGPIKEDPDKEWLTDLSRIAKDKADELIKQLYGNTKGLITPLSIEDVGVREKITKEIEAVVPFYEKVCAETMFMRDDLTLFDAVRIVLNDEDLVQKYTDRLRQIDSVYSHQLANYFEYILHHWLKDFRSGGDYFRRKERAEKIESDIKELRERHMKEPYRELISKYITQITEWKDSVQTRIEELNENLREEEVKKEEYKQNGWGERDDWFIKHYAEDLERCKRTLDGLMFLISVNESPDTQLASDKEYYARHVLSAVIDRFEVSPKQDLLFKFREGFRFNQVEYSMIRDEFQKMLAILWYAYMIREFSFAKVEFTEDLKVKIEKGWSLVMGSNKWGREKEEEEKVSVKDRQVKNDVTFDASELIKIISGSNMSGKTFLEKMIVWNMLSAQVSGFAPSEKMTAPVFGKVIYLDRITEKLFRDLSSYGHEIKFWNEFFKLFDNQNGPVLVLGITDEAYSTTSPKYQSALSYGVAEEVIRRGGFLVIASHNHDFIEAFKAQYPGASKVYHLRTRVNREGEEVKVHFDYVLEEGHDLSNAIDVAESMGFKAITDIVRENEKKQTVAKSKKDDGSIFAVSGHGKDVVDSGEDRASILTEDGAAPVKSEGGSTADAVHAIMGELFGGLSEEGEGGKQTAFLKKMLESMFSRGMNAEDVFEYKTADTENGCEFVISPQRTVLNRDNLMANVLAFREFLESEAAEEILAIYALPEMFQTFAIADWVLKHREKMESVLEILERAKGTAAEILARFPKYIFEEMPELKQEYPGLNLLPSMLMWTLSMIDSENHPDEYISDDILTIVRKLRDKGIKVNIASLRSNNFSWPRDLISWTDERHYIDTKIGKIEGSLAEGGMVVSGNGDKGRFVLVSKKASVEYLEWLRQKDPDLDVVPVHPGFVTIKHKGILYHMPYEHIDSVVGVVPAELTKDGRGKLLVDPQYYQYEEDTLIKLALRQGLDIVFVDNDELHLQMPNFTIIKGNILLNRGEKTISALNLKDGVAIYPDVPNTENVFGCGSYRCQSNILPKEKIATLQILDEDVPISTEALVRSLHLSVFWGQKPKKDVVGMISEEIKEQGYSRDIIYKAFLDYAEKNSGESPSWLSVGVILEKMAELKASASEIKQEVAVSARKVFEQAGLNSDQNINAANIVDRAGLQPGDKVLDIGPATLVNVAVAATSVGASVDVINLTEEENSSRLLGHKRFYGRLIMSINEILGRELPLPKYYTGKVQDADLEEESYQSIFLFNVLDDPRISDAEKEEIFLRALKLLKENGNLFISFLYPQVVKKMSENNMSGLVKLAEDNGYKLEIQEVGIPTESDRLLSREGRNYCIHFVKTKIVEAAHMSDDPNVTCGTICDSKHHGSWDALDSQLTNQFEILRRILKRHDSNDLTEEEADFAMVEYAKRFGVKVTVDELKKYRADIKAANKTFQNIQIFFLMPENAPQLFWVGDDYAGGHFNRKGTRIHISLPVIVNNGIQAGIDIALHDLGHIQGKGHVNDDGMRWVTGIAESEHAFCYQPDKHTLVNNANGNRFAYRYIDENNPIDVVIGNQLIRLIKADGSVIFLIYNLENSKSPSVEFKIEKDGPVNIGRSQKTIGVVRDADGNAIGMEGVVNDIYLPETNTLASRRQIQLKIENIAGEKTRIIFQDLTSKNGTSLYKGGKYLEHDVSLKIEKKSVETPDELLKEIKYEMNVYVKWLNFIIDLNRDKPEWEKEIRDLFVAERTRLAGKLTGDSAVEFNEEYSDVFLNHWIESLNAFKKEILFLRGMKINLIIRQQGHINYAFRQLVMKQVKILRRIPLGLLAKCSSFFPFVISDMEKNMGPGGERVLGYKRDVTHGTVMLNNENFRLSRSFSGESLRSVLGGSDIVDPQEMSSAEEERMKKISLSPDTVCAHEFYHHLHLDEGVLSPEDFIEILKQADKRKWIHHSMYGHTIYGLPDVVDMLEKAIKQGPEKAREEMRRICREYSFVFSTFYGPAEVVSFCLSDDVGAYKELGPKRFNSVRAIAEQRMLRSDKPVVVRDTKLRKHEPIYEVYSFAKGRHFVNYVNERGGVLYTEFNVIRNDKHILDEKGVVDIIREISRQLLSRGYSRDMLCNYRDLLRNIVVQQQYSNQPLFFLDDINKLTSLYFDLDDLQKSHMLVCDAICRAGYQISFEDRLKVVEMIIDGSNVNVGFDEVGDADDGSLGSLAEGINYPDLGDVRKAEIVDHDTKGKLKSIHRDSVLNSNGESFANVVAMWRDDKKLEASLLEEISGFSDIDNWTFINEDESKIAEEYAKMSIEELNEVFLGLLKNGKLTLCEAKSIYEFLDNISDSHWFGHYYSNGMQPVVFWLDIIAKKGETDLLKAKLEKVLPFKCFIRELTYRWRRSLEGAKPIQNAHQQIPESVQKLLDKAKIYSYSGTTDDLNVKGTAINNYITHTQKQKYMFLYTDDIAIKDLPSGYFVSLRDVDEKKLSWMRVNVNFPETDVLLVSKHRNGSGAVVRLGWLDDGTPVAVKTYSTESISKNRQSIRREYKEAFAADCLGIGPRLYGIFNDDEKRSHIVMNIVPGEFPERNTAHINVDTVKDLIEIYERIVDSGRSIYSDFQFYVTPNGRVVVIDFDGLGSESFNFDRFVQELIYLLSFAKPSVQNEALRYMAANEKTLFNLVCLKLNMYVESVNLVYASKSSVRRVSSLQKRAEEIKREMSLDKTQNGDVASRKEIPEFIQKLLTKAKTFKDLGTTNILKNGGLAVENYVNTVKKPQYMYIETKDISRDDLPAGYCMEMRDISSEVKSPVELHVNMPAEDVFLISDYYNGSMGIVRLGWLDDGTPVALKADYKPLEAGETPRSILREYDDYAIFDQLGIGPKLYGTFKDAEGKDNIVMSIVSGDFITVMKENINTETIRDIIQIHERLIANGRSMHIDFQYFITPSGRIVFIDPEGISNAPIDDMNDYLRELILCLVNADLAIQVDALSEVARENLGLLKLLKQKADAMIGALRKAYGNAPQSYMSLRKNIRDAILSTESDRGMLINSGDIAGKYMDGLLATIRTKARSCKDIDEELVLAIDMDIGNLKNYAQELFVSINSIQDVLNKEGLDNVRIFVGAGDELKGKLEKYLDEKGDKKNFVISAVLKSSNSETYTSLKDKINITTVDDSKMPNTNIARLHYVPIIPIIELSIKSAIHADKSSIVKEYSSIPNIENIIVAKDGTVQVILTPKSKPIPINDLREQYELESRLLVSA